MSYLGKLISTATSRKASEFVLPPLDESQESPPQPTSTAPIAGIKYLMDYNGGNIKGQRKIHANSFMFYEPKSSYYLRAYCFERQATRCFSVEKINWLALANTGEIFNNPLEHLLESYTPEISDEWVKINKKETPSYLKFFKEFQHEIQILSYLSSIDGFIDNRELSQAMVFIAQQLEDKNIFISDDEVDKLSRIFSNISPDDFSLIESIEYLRKDTTKSKRFLRMAKNIIQIDGVIVEEEMKAIVELEQLLQAPSSS